MVFAVGKQMSKLGLSIKEAAKLLGVHPNTLYRLVWHGEVKAARLGTRLIIPKGELERILGCPLDLEGAENPDRPGVGQ
jgi:excisionase family DNA binding protein